MDLHDLISVMHLSSGVSEFKNTGNCRTLLEQIPETESELRKALENFDWATQVNSFDKVQKSLTELLRITEREQTDSSRYADLNHMINEVLRRKFLNLKDDREKASEVWERMSIADRRLMTAKWYLNQNRYGQAAATAYEALKSHLVPVYLKKVKAEVREEDYLNEDYLTDAIRRLSYVYTCLKRRKSSLSGMEEFFLELEGTRKKPLSSGIVLLII